MANIICSACSMENDCNAAKCEHCQFTLSHEDCPAIDEWESAFRFIEEAELKGEVYKLEGFEEGFCKVEPNENIQITQSIKEEPEIQIEPEAATDKQKDCDSASALPDQYSYQCRECGRCFKRKATLTAHLNANHNREDSDSKQLRKRPREAKKNPEYKCESCHKISKDLDEHTQHLQSHELHKSLQNTFFECNQCNERFAKKFELKVHQNQHDGKKVFQCDVCKVFLSNKNILEHHKLKLHNENTSPAEKNKFMCFYCGERFPLQVLLTNHKKTHMEDAQQIEKTAFICKVGGRLAYICKMCGKSSSDKSRHTDHIRVHTKEKPFKCDLCGGGFTARGSLLHHKRLHSDDRKLFKCNICGVAYRDKRNLRKHSFKHTGERPFKCQYCDKTFALKNVKGDHERLQHTGETPYECEVCQDCFKTSSILNAHRRDEHDIDTNSKPRVEILIKKVNESGVKR